ncbi:MAG: tyrosine-type recombinase/integrase [Flavobacteriaceae bacterium]
MQFAANARFLAPIEPLVPAKDAHNRPLPFAPEECQPEIRAYVSNFIAQAPFRKKKGGQLGLQVSSIRNYHNFLQHYCEFESEWAPGQNLLFQDLNAPCVDGFIRWLLEKKQFSTNHAGRLIATFKTLALDAKRNGLKVHPAIRSVSGFSQNSQERLINILTFDDLEKIKQVTLPKHLDNARRWMVIGFWLGQRVSDLLTLEPYQLRETPNGGLYVDIHQQKTDKKVTVGVIDPTALNMLRNHFPRKLYAPRFNKYLKLVLKEAGIHQMVKGYKFNPTTKRKEMGLFPKYSVIASHDLRRSFATNFFGKIPTPILMNMTGHSRESTFMSYIGRDPNRDAVADRFMEAVRRLDDQFNAV